MSVPYEHAQLIRFVKLVGGAGRGEIITRLPVGERGGGEVLLRLQGSEGGRVAFVLLFATEGYGCAEGHCLVDDLHWALRGGEEARI